MTTTTARPAWPYAQAMLLVLLACLPGASALVFFFGWGVVVNCVWLTLLAVVIEAAALKLRKEPVLPRLRDCSALVTAILLALALPPAAPWWLGLTGIVVALVGAKHLCGGIGRNVLNPAMAGYAVLLLAFPAQMTRWLLPEGATEALPSLTDSLLMFADRTPDTGIDAFIGATALDSFRQDRSAQLVSEFAANSPVMGRWSGLGWEWINGGFLLGGLYLVYRRVIGWQIPGTLLLALAVWALLFHDGGSSASGGSPLFHLFGGATMLGAFFIATDPVTAPATMRGRLAYGALIGSLVYAMRRWSEYPDGVAFAVLAGNLAAPLLDAALRPAMQQRRVTLERAWIYTCAAIAAATLVLLTADVITRGTSDERELLAQVMPAARHDNDLTESSFLIDPGANTFVNTQLLGLTEARNAYRARLDGRASGVVLPLVAPDGYGGPIELLIGIDTDGVITGVRAVRHEETRGLGDAIEPEVSRWILGFDNRSLENTDDVLWAIKKDGGDFDQFLGATVTPRATIAAIHNGLQFFALNRERLLDE